MKSTLPTYRQRQTDGQTSQNNSNQPKVSDFKIEDTTRLVKINKFMSSFHISFSFWTMVIYNIFKRGYSAGICTYFVGPMRHRATVQTTSDIK